jgi:hypothetical protein
VNVGQWVSTHQKQTAIGGGAAGVVGFALYRKTKAAASSGTTSSSSAGSTVPAGTTGGVAYDSSADDVYNSVEGVLEQLQGTIGQLNTASTVASSTPVSTEPSTAVASASTIVQPGINATTDSIPVNANVAGGTWIAPATGPWTQLITAPNPTNGAMETIAASQATTTQLDLANAAAPKSTSTTQPAVIGPSSYSVIGYANPNTGQGPIFG